jgi:hypothetical protein
MRRLPPPAATVVMSSWGVAMVMFAVVVSNTCGSEPA